VSGLGFCLVRLLRFLVFLSLRGFFFAVVCRFRFVGVLGCFCFFVFNYVMVDWGFFLLAL
ncbi:hypothetical protein, partial [Pseudoalteromonas marina]